VIVVLGSVAFDQVWKILSESGGAPTRRVRFGHLVETALADGRTLICSYHPSQQNTFTGKLTEPMFDQVWRRARELVGATGS
jgi:uracil-DNA glycosylase